MGRRKGVDTQIGVTRGFVTEFTPVSFPREAAIDLDNVILDADGSVRRRPGVDLERQFKANSVNGGVLVDQQLRDYAFTTHLWEFVSNSGTLNIVVQQMGQFLHFYAQFGAISANLLGTMDLQPHATDVAKLRKAPIQVASGLGNLYVVNEHMEPIRIKFDGTSFSAVEILLRIRHLDGLDDGLAVDERPAFLSRNHYYNLRNQGWTDKNLRKFGGAPDGTDLCALSGQAGGLGAGQPQIFDLQQALDDCEAEGRTGLGVISCAIEKQNAFVPSSTGLWPSNADNMTVGIVSNQDGNLEFDPDFIINDNFGNTPSAKGHFIVEAFNPDYDEALDCPGTGSALFLTRSAAVTFHQGRAFYSTPNVQNIVGGVFYSQQLTEIRKDGECFQEADPTASEINDLIDTDGGFLPMPGVGQIYSLREIGNGVAVIASNGVWFITGGDGESGMTATNIRLDKISKFGALGPTSIVEAAESIFFWGIDGVVQLSTGEGFGLEAEVITNTSIQSFYISIPADARRDAAAVYIPEARKIFWSYREGSDSSPSLVSHNRFLILDFDIRGWYKYSIAEQAGTMFPEIVGLSLIKPLSTGSSILPITELDGGTIFELDGIEAITEETTFETGQITQMKMACFVFDTVLNGWKITFATFHSRSFTDWRDNHPTGVGIPMTSFVEFAEFQMAGHITKGVVNYVHSFFQKESKNLASGGYWELPPLFYESTGLRLSQSVIEVLNKPSSNLRLGQSVIEVLLKSPSDFRLGQSLVEVLHDS